MRTVVGVALVVGGRVLAARRSRPAHHAGRWELPGGSVEPGEDLATAAAREVAEELGCRVSVGAELPGRADLGPDLELRAVLASLQAGDPVPHEHGAVRWLRADQLDEVDWLEADRVLLPGLVRALEAAAAGTGGR